MSFFDDASLAFLPSGGAGKDGKAYSIKPTDGTGDFTFSRGSNLTATRVGPTGLIEKGRENLLLQSNQFDTTWSVILGGNLSGGQSGYDGSNDAWRFTKASGQSSRIYQNITLSSTLHTTSIYAKAGTLQYLAILEFNGSFVYFDLQNGTIGTISGSPIDVKIEAVGATGWYRCSITDKYDITQLRIYASDTDGSISGSGNIYIQDAQVEQGLVATDYIETGASTAQAGILEDMPRLDYSGSCPALLLEPQRSNILSHSEYLPTGMSFARSTFTNNDAISPEGLANATKWQMTSDTGSHYLRKGFTTSDTYSVSVFAKKGNYRYLGLRSGSTLIGFDFDTETFVGGTGTKEAFGDGWWRLSVTATGSGFSYFGIHYSNASGGEQTTADGTEYYHIYGMQLEQASYPTSYIPNHSGGSATRTADDCQDAGDTTSINSTEGVLYVEASALANDGTSRMISLSDATSANHIRIYPTTTNNRITIAVKSGNVNQYVYHYDGLSDITETWKVAVKYKANDFATFVNGTKVHSSTSGITPVGMNELQYNGGASANPFYGNVKQTLVFPTALSDADCITLTT